MSFVFVTIGDNLTAMFLYYFNSAVPNPTSRPMLDEELLMLWADNQSVNHSD